MGSCTAGACACAALHRTCSTARRGLPGAAEACHGMARHPSPPPALAYQHQLSLLLLCSSNLRICLAHARTRAGEGTASAYGINPLTPQATGASKCQPAASAWCTTGHVWQAGPGTGRPRAMQPRPVRSMGIRLGAAEERSAMRTGGALWQPRPRAVSGMHCTHAPASQPGGRTRMHAGGEAPILV